MTTDSQPISSVEWVPREDLFSNEYNPNAVAPPEMKLLELSIVEDGWTQPIVAKPDGEIVDGFHRWTVSARRKVYDKTGGLVPVVRLEGEPSDLRMSTIRHNRARGSHGVIAMASIVDFLNEDGLDPEEIQRRLGMSAEEFDRLLERGVVERYGAEKFSRAWVPAFEEELDDNNSDPGFDYRGA